MESSELHFDLAAPRKEIGRGESKYEILCVDRSWAGVRKVDKEVGHQLDIVRTMVDSLLDILLWTKKIKRNLYK